jgi:hypothetical protein
MRGRMLYRLTWLAVGLSVGHYGPPDPWERCRLAGPRPSHLPEERLAVPALGLAYQEFPGLNGSSRWSDRSLSPGGRLLVEHHGGVAIVGGRGRLP